MIEDNYKQRGLRGKLVRQLRQKGIRDEARATETERRKALETMLTLYAAGGLTSIGDRAVGECVIGNDRRVHGYERYRVARWHEQAVIETAVAHARRDDLIAV